MGKYAEFETRTQPWFDEAKFDGFNFAIPMKTLAIYCGEGWHRMPASGDLSNNGRSARVAWKQIEVRCLEFSREEQPNYMATRVNRAAAPMCSKPIRQVDAAKFMI